MRVFFAICFCLAVFVAGASQARDSLTGLRASVLTVNERGIEETETFMDFSFGPHWVVYNDVCNRTAIGRNGFKLGVPFDETQLGPVILIYCESISEESVLIGTLLSESERLVVETESGLVRFIKDGDVLLTLQLND